MNSFYNFKFMADPLGCVQQDLFDVREEASETKHQEVSQVVREIKAFAKDIDLPVVLLSQLSQRDISYFFRMDESVQFFGIITT